MLKADKDFLELLKEQHGIEITQQDLNCIHEFQYFQELERKEKLAKTHSNDLNVQNLPVLGIVAGGALGLLAAPLLGISVLSAVLIGASIGWRLLGGGQKKESKQQQQEQNKKVGASAQNFGFNTAPTIVPLGGAIPMIFCNRNINANGGVRTSGFILNSRVDTANGIQKLYILYGLSLGKIKSFDSTKTLIDGQTINTFFSDEIVQSFKNGEISQTAVSEFPFYSQINNLSTKTYFGIAYRGRTSNTVGYNAAYIETDPETTGNYNRSDTYAVSYLDDFEKFKITNIVEGATSLTIDRNVQFNPQVPVFALYDASFTTTKKCSEIHINFVFRISSRNENNELVKHGIVFDLFLDNVRIGRLSIDSLTDSEQYRSIKIKNLTYAKHIVYIEPNYQANEFIPHYKIATYNETNYNTGVILGGKEVSLVVGGGINGQVALNASGVFDYVNTTKRYFSNEQNAPCKITTVNEIVYPSDLGHSGMCAYPGMSLASLVVQATDRIQSDPSPSFFISQGQEIKYYLMAGVAGTNSNNTFLYDLSQNFLTKVPPNNGGNSRINTVVRNLDKQLEASSFLVFTNHIITSTNLQFEPGDRYVIFIFESSNYFPDIFCHLLTSKVGGLAGFLPSQLIEDFFIDYQSVMTAKDFCIANNYFWDGAIDSTINFEEFVTRETIGSLLFPSRIGGRYGLIPEQQTNPVAIFSASNIIENSYSEENIQIDNLNCIHVTFNDGADDFKPRVISVMTEAAYNGTEPLFPESLKFDSITNQAQAEKVGKIYLKSRLLQTKVVTFTTGLQGFAVREGDLIFVQYIVTETLNDFSGFVIDALHWNEEYQDVKLSVPMPKNLPANYPGASTYKLENKIIERELGCSLVLNGSEIYLRIYNLENSLDPGDYVIVTSDITHRRTFRIQKIEPLEDGSVTVNAVLWVPEILDGSDLFVVD